jgi:hypothetical protein
MQGLLSTNKTKTSFDQIRTSSMEHAKKYLSAPLIQRVRCAAVIALLTTLLPTSSSAQPEPAVKTTTTVKQMVRQHRNLRLEGIRSTDGTGPESLCQGTRFKPCVCADQVNREVQYRPSITECGKNAGIILYGQYLSAFSIVLRDSDNRDRWPAFGFNGCSKALANSESPPASCSVFKAQKKIRVARRTADEGILYCFGASGYSPLMRRVVRATVKLRDIPGSSADPLVRWCLNGPTQPLN